MRGIFGLMLAALFLAGCQKTYDDQMGALENHLRGNKVGQSSDVWLIKRNAFGDLEKTALFFGYWDDYSACSEMAAIYDAYSCGYAN
jgi:hypothetical protein